MSAYHSTAVKILVQRLGAKIGHNRTSDYSTTPIFKKPI